MLYSELNNITEIKKSYLIVGEDSFLMQNAQNLLLNKLNLKTGDIDYEIFDEETFSIDKFFVSVTQMPFICEYKMIVVKNLTTLTETAKRNLLSYLENPNPNAVVVFIDSYNNKVFSFLERYCEIVECKKANFVMCEEFCLSIAKEHNINIDKNALNLLIELTNFNLNSLKAEMTKLCFYASDTITYDMVYKNVSKTLDYQVYELTTALSKKQTDKALEILKDMIAHKETNGLIALITNNFRRMFFASINDNIEETANLLKVKPFAISKLKEQSKNFSQKKLKDINYMLEEIDYKVKSGEMQTINALYYLVFELCK